ncbi:4987_t:CDS:2, partial [Funneliformis caledonium]
MFHIKLNDIKTEKERRETKNSEKSERETEMPENKHRWSNDPSYHYMGCSCPLLYDQHWQTSGVFDFARSADKMRNSTLKPVGKIGFNFRANTRGCQDNQEHKNQGPNPTDNNSCSVKIRRTEDENLVQDWEFEKESRVLAIWELCENDHIVLSSIMETGTTNQNSCDKDSNSRNDSTLRELPPNHESQHIQDVTSLLDNYCFWLKVPDGVIYLWSHLDDILVHGRDNIKEALKNYLFHQENLRYVDENSLELIPLDKYDEEAEEWAKSPEAYVNID